MGREKVWRSKGRVSDAKHVFVGHMYMVDTGEYYCQWNWVT